MACVAEIDAIWCVLLFGRHSHSSARTLIKYVEMQSTRWQSPLVVVVASYDGIVSDAPWLVNSSAVTYVVYQRTKPDEPNYVPNIGYEAGVYLRFVLDHYDDLPDQTAFIQEQPEMHNRAWLEWLNCLLPTSNCLARGP